MPDITLDNAQVEYLISLWPQDFEICETRSYPYSGMTEDECLGIVFDGEPGHIGFAIDNLISALALNADAHPTITSEQIAPLAECLKQVRTDSMGTSMIAYFPQIVVDPSLYIESTDENW